jgi:hypothetical protein
MNPTGLQPSSIAQFLFFYPTQRGKLHANNEKSKDPTKKQQGLPK